MTPPSSNHGEDHQGSNNKIEDRRKYRVVIRLGKRSSLIRDLNDVDDTCNVGDKKD